VAERAAAERLAEAQAAMDRAAAERALRARVEAERAAANQAARAEAERVAAEPTARAEAERAAANQAARAEAERVAAGQAARAETERTATNQAERTAAARALAERAAAARQQAEAAATRAGLSQAEVARLGAPAEARARGGSEVEIRAAGSHAVREVRLARGNPDGAAIGYIEAADRLERNLQADHRIQEAFRTVSNRSGNPEVRRNVAIQLTRAYNRTVPVLDHFKAQARRNRGWQLDYDRIAADPYLEFHNENIHMLVPENVEAAEWNAMKTALLAVVEQADAADPVPLKRNRMLSVFQVIDTATNLESARVVKKRIKTNVRLPGMPGQVTLDADTVPKLIQLLQLARQRGFTGTAGAGRLHPELTGLPLTENLIKAEVVDPDSATLDEAENSPTYMEPNGYGRFRDPVLGPAWSAFEFPRAGLARSLQDGNDYFLPAADGRPQNFRLTDRFWHHVLQKYGYIETLP